MSGQEGEIVELRSASVGRKQQQQQGAFIFPRSLSSTTILLRSSSRALQNGMDPAAEMKEVRENVITQGKQEGSGEGLRVDNTVVNLPNSRSTREHVEIDKAGKMKQEGGGQEDLNMKRHVHRVSSPCKGLVGLWQSSLVELIASLVLTFVSVAAVIACLRAEFSYPRIAVAATQFLIYTMCIVAAAPLSGAHLNPSFSFTCMLMGHMSPTRGILYMLAQSLGSVLGALFVRAAVPADIAQMYYLGGCLLKQQVLDTSLNVVSSIGADSGPALVAELFFSFLLISIALPLLILPPHPRPLSSLNPAAPLDQEFRPTRRLQPLYHNISFSDAGLPRASLHSTFTSFTDPALIRAAFIIGLLLGLLIFISGQLLSPGYTSAGMNPARCFGPAVAEGGTALWQPQWVFWLGPLLAGLIFAILYRIVFTNHPCGRSYDNDPHLLTQDHTAESAQGKVPLLGSSNFVPAPNTFSEVVDFPQEINPNVPSNPALNHTSTSPTNPTSRRMDVFLHIKATMEKPDQTS